MMRTSRGSLSATSYRPRLTPTRSDSFRALKVLRGDSSRSEKDIFKRQAFVQLDTALSLRSLGVLVGAEWEPSTDLRNLDAVVLELFRTVQTFSCQLPAATYGHYELKEHLQEIVDLFRPFPKNLIAKGDSILVEELFDDEGNIKGFAATR